MSYPHPYVSDVSIQPKYSPYPQLHNNHHNTDNNTEYLRHDDGMNNPRFQAVPNYTYSHNLDQPGHSNPTHSLTNGNGHQATNDQSESSHTISLSTTNSMYFYQASGKIALWKDIRLWTSVLTVFTTFFFMACNAMIFDSLRHPDRARRILHIHSFIQLFFWTGLAQLIKFSLSFIRYPLHYLCFNPSVLKVYHPITFSSLSASDQPSSLNDSTPLGDAHLHLSQSTLLELLSDPNSPTTTLQLPKHNYTRLFPLPVYGMNVISPVFYFGVATVTLFFSIWNWADAWGSGDDYYKTGGGSMGTFFVVGELLCGLVFLTNCLACYIFHQRMRYYDLVWGPNEYREYFVLTNKIPTKKRLQEALRQLTAVSPVEVTGYGAVEDNVTRNVVVEENKFDHLPTAPSTTLFYPSAHPDQRDVPNQNQSYPQPEDETHARHAFPKVKSRNVGLEEEPPTSKQSPPQYHQV